MAILRSLGKHTPAGLDFLVNEGLLPQNPPSSSYTWTVYGEQSGCETEEELITTRQCVVWSQGELVRRVFRFSHENQHVQHAVLTWFSTEASTDNVRATTEGSNRPQYTDHRPEYTPRPSQKKNSTAQPKQSRALVVLLHSQAHVYFLNGRSHTINIPFEVEKIFPAPRGVILQRKQAKPQQIPRSPAPPAPPPNSFWSSQNQANSFNDQDGLYTFLQPTLSVPPSRGSYSVISVPSGNPTSTSKDLPFLFTLTDPLSELGLVVGGVESSLSSSSQCLEPISEDEEILYVTPYNEIPGLNDNDFPVILVITVNHVNHTYSLWHASYAGEQALSDPSDIAPNFATTPRLKAKKRRSYATRLSTGAGTPALRVGDLPSEQSFSNQAHTTFEGSHNTSQRVSESFMLDGEYDADIPSQDDFHPGRRSRPTTRSTRRTSSMLARAELSGQEQYTFNDMARHPTAQSGSLGRYSRRPPSFGFGSLNRSRLSGRASTPGSTSFLSDVDESINQDGAVDFLEELLASATVEADDRAALRLFRGLKKELIMVKSLTIPMEQPSIPTSQALPAPDKDTHVSIITPTPSQMQTLKNFSFHVYIVNPNVSIASELIIPTTVLDLNNTRVIPQRTPWNRKLPVPSNRFRVRHHKNTLDLTKISDKGYHYAIALLANEHERSGVCLRVHVPEITDSTIHTEQISSIHISVPILCGNELCLIQKDLSCLLVEDDKLNSGETSSPPRRFYHAGSLGCFDVATANGLHYRLQLCIRPRNQKTSKALMQFQKSVMSTAETYVDIRPVWLAVVASHEMGSINEWHCFILSIIIIVLGYMGDARGDVFRGDVFLPQATDGFLERKQRISVKLEKDVAWCWCAKTLPNVSHASDEDERFSIAYYLSRSREIFKVDYSKTEDSVFKSITRRVPSHDELLRVVVMVYLMIEDEKLFTNTRNSSGRYEITLSKVLMQLALWFGLNPLVSRLESRGEKTQGLDQRCIVALGPNANSIHWPAIQYLFASQDTTTTRDLEFLLKLTSTKYNTTQKGLAPGREQSILFSEARHLFMKANHDHFPQLLIENLLSGHLQETVFDNLAPAVTRCLRSALLQFRDVPPTTWSRQLLRLVGREDLATLLDSSIGRADTELQSSATQPVHRDLQSISEGHEHELDRDKPQQDQYDSLLQYIFRHDKRWVEAARLLDPIRIAVATVLPMPGQTESAFLEKQKEVAQKVHQRTMALPSGQAIFRYDANRPMMTEKIKISTFNTTCNMQPSNNSVNADKQNFTEEKVGWAYFHAGVNAGLQVSKDAEGIDTSWLVLNKPENLGIRHAGLLLGLGLNGHLRKMARWLAFQYLTSKHTMTSVGLLLGLSASNLGSQDSLVTRLISVHVTRLLPPGAAQLNISPLTQTAGIMGVGLLYYNTQHRRMSEVMLSEIENVDLDEHQHGTTEDTKDEPYRFGAGCSLGLINLGMGGDLRALHDLDLVQRLLIVATGPRQIKSVHVLDQAISGATMALAMIFMKTHDSSVSTKLDPLESTHHFDQTRPDVLLLRTVAKWLIMWDDIQPSLDWVKDNTVLVDPRLSPLDADNIPSYNIIAGLCWALSLKYAGTNSMLAISVLQHYNSHVRDLLTQAPSKATFDNNLTLSTLQRFHHLLALSLATVCAGSGDLSVFRELRAMHAEIEGKTFGLHQATHMAIGLLFVGHGRYTIGTSNLAIAAMLMSFYPLFPRDVHDNRACLQATRHFWVLGAEPRCLVPRDVKTMKPIVLPIDVVLKSDSHSSSRHRRPRKPPETKVVRITAPAHIPPLDEIAQIRVVSAAFWSVTLDFENNKSHLEAFRRHQSIFLQHKPLTMQFDGRLGTTLALLNHGEEAEADALRATKWVFKSPSFSSVGVDGGSASVLDPTDLNDTMTLYADIKGKGTSWDRLMWLKRLVDGEGRLGETTLRGMIGERMRK